jgi:hypothetical protein
MHGGTTIKNIYTTWCTHTYICSILWRLIRCQGDNARWRSVEGHGRSPFECIALYQRLCVWTVKTTNKVRAAEISCKTEREFYTNLWDTRFSLRQCWKFQPSGTLRCVNYYRVSIFRRGIEPLQRRHLFDNRNCVALRNFIDANLPIV